MSGITPAEPKIGDKMPDGTIYAGISPDTKKALYATPKDAPASMSFQEAADYADSLDAHGHRDWRVPTIAELKVLSAHHVAIGGFNCSGPVPANWYWSASQYYKRNAWVLRLSDGCKNYIDKAGYLSLRCIR